MKAKNFVFCILAVTTWHVIMKATPPEGDDVKMLGQQRELSEVIKPGVDIVLAQLLSDDHSTLGEIGVMVHIGTKIRVVSSLQGTLAGEVKVNYTVRSFPPEDKETAPVLNTQYLFFFEAREANPNRFRAVKILPATADNIAATNALIAQQRK